ncbi:MAG: sodium:calcium antiporter [Bacteroidota bacterium]|jgi:cation:H+ antiporter|nr:sodium:calcium antiporter [Burkholderiales bacterium]
MLLDIGWLLAGALCAGLGGDLFVRGAVRTATWLRIRPGLIGATVAAFATSAPELAVSITAALEGAPPIALGNALGANVVNLGLALGLSLLVGPSQLSQGGVARDLPAAFAVPALTALFLIDGRLGRIDAGLLLAVFGAWLVLSIRQERETPEARVPFSRRERAETAGLVAAGVALLLVAGEAFVTGAVGLADRFGWDRFVVGATLVAVGTTIPELATSVVAKLRGHDEIGLGTLLGSCLFNGAFIVPAAALITPPIVAFGEVAVALGTGVLLVLAALPYRSATLGRARGVLMLALYIAYIVALALG